MINRIQHNIQKFFKEGIFEISENKIVYDSKTITIIDPKNPLRKAIVDYHSSIEIIVIDPENKFFNRIFNEILETGKKGDAVIIWGSNSNDVYLGVVELKTTLGTFTLKDALTQIKNTILGMLLILRFLKNEPTEYYGIIFYESIKIKEDTPPTELDPYINQYDQVMDKFLEIASEKLNELNKTHDGIRLAIDFPEQTKTIPIMLYGYHETLILNDKGIDKI